MKALAISFQGMEDITALEIKELIGKEVEEKEGCCLFECSEEELAKYCYLGQGVNRVLVLLDSFKIKSEDDLVKVNQIDFSKWLKGTFAVRCEIVDNDLIKQGYIVGNRGTSFRIDPPLTVTKEELKKFTHVFKTIVRMKKRQHCR